MKTCAAVFILVAFIYLQLLLLTCESHSATFYSTENNNRLICHDEFMSVYISKKQFADLPFTIYVQDNNSGYYQAVAIAKQCLYVFGETDSFVVLTVAVHGCFVKTRKYTTHLTIVIMALTDEGRVKTVKSIPLICERKIKANKTNFPKQFFCSKDGFNITIPQDATVPSLNLDSVWIPSGQNHSCKPKKISSDAVTFTFPFTDCGTQSVIADGNITFWINVEVKQHPDRGVIIRDSPFLLTVQCSFALSQMSQVGLRIQLKTPEYPSALKSKGILRTEMRFAKDSSYRSFYSSEHPAVCELGQSVYVDVFAVKHEDEDLVLLLEDCWATPTVNPHDQQRWNLLVKGCPFTGDNHRTAVLSVSKEVRYPSLHKWFVVNMFSFVKPPTSENLVYFHCHIEICKGPDCTPHCSSGKRNVRRIQPRLGQRIFYSVVSGGPLLYLL